MLISFSSILRIVNGLVIYKDNKVIVEPIITIVLKIMLLESEIMKLYRSIYNARVCAV